MANFCYFNAKYAAENGSQLDSRPSFGAHNVNEAVTFFNSTGDSPTMKLGSEPGTSSSIIDLDIKSRHKNENLSEMSSNAHTGAKEEVKEVGKDVGSSVDEFPCPLLTCTFRGPKVVQHLMSRHRLTRRQGLAILMPVEFDYNNGKAKGVSKGKKYCPIAGCVRRIRKGQTLGSHLRTDHGFKRRQGIQTAKKLYPPDGICNFKPFGAMLDACDEAESEGSDDEESASNKQTLQSDQAQGFSDVPNLYQSRSTYIVQFLICQSTSRTS